MEVGPAHKSNSELKSREVALRTPKCEAGVAVGAHVTLADAQGLGWRPGCGQAQGHASFVQCDWMDWDAMGWHGMGWDGTLRALGSRNFVERGCASDLGLSTQLKGFEAQVAG